MKNLNQIKEIDLKQIIPDEKQPRKYFDAKKIATLKTSIEKHGILAPLVVKNEGNGTYLIVDGERRFRAATLAKLKTVPVVEDNSKDDVDRLVQQFHIQELHEGWTIMEKANAVYGLSNKLGANIENVCNILGINQRTAQSYTAFMKLANKEAFERSEIPFSWAKEIDFFYRSFVRNYKEQFDEMPPKETKKKLEGILISKIAEGEITNRSDLTKIKDSFVKDPSVLKKITTSNKWTAQRLFKESNAKSAAHLRKVVLYGGYLSSSINRYLENPEIKPTAKQIISIRSLLNHAKKIEEYFKNELK